MPQRTRSKWDDGRRMAAAELASVLGDLVWMGVAASQPGWPLPPAVINLVPGASFPANFTYSNFGKQTQKGLELGVNTTLNRYVGMFANYSFQAKPEANFALSELNLPAKNRFNVGFNFNRDRFLGDVNVTYSDSAFWQDVLDDRYHGTTEAYTLVNGGFGVKWLNNRLTTSVKGTNLGNQTIQQHVFGDIIKRSIVGEFKVNLPK